MEEPCVRVFFPGVSEPYEYDADSDTVFVESRLGKLHHCTGILKKRGRNREVGTTTLKAGDYDFHITDQTPPQQGK